MLRAEVGRLTRIRRQLGESGVAFAAVFANPNLRRLELAAFGSNIGQWAYSIAISVYAFEQSGAKAVGLVWLIRMLPAAVCAPFGGSVADRFPRERVMLACDLGRIAIIAAAAASIWTDAPAALVYALSGVFSLVKLPFRPAQSALTPELATTPTELTAANVVASSIDSVGFFLGPALAGIILGFASVPTVLVITAGTLAWSAMFIARIRVTREEAPEQPREVTARFGPVLSDALEGFRVLVRDSRLRILVGLLAATTLVVGVLEVLTVSVALSLLHGGTSVVGYLNSAFGVGALLGAFAAATLVGVRRLSIPFVVGTALWGPPVAIIGIWPSTAVAVICLGLLGIGNTLIDVAGFTLVQRAVPDATLARVFSVVQTVWLATTGIGAIVAPALISGLWGIRGALIATGVFLPVLLVLLGPRLLRIDAAATAPSRTLLELLQATTIFAPLPGRTLEHIASLLIPVEVTSGATIIAEGDRGDRFFIVGEGRVEVTVAQKHVANLGPGDYIGEIALLRDVPRTATCVAQTNVKLYALERDDFLGAVLSHAPVRSALEESVSARLTDLRSLSGALPVPDF
jgi:MFS family permease